MMFQDAQRTLEGFLSPLSLDEFLDRTLVGGFGRIGTGAIAARTELLGPHPTELLLRAQHLAATLTYHSANPAGPPPSLKAVADEADFRSRIAQLHARNYSVRFPTLRPLSAPLESIARALEILLHQPVSASAFWSLSGLHAPVHCDDHDLLVVQLRGTKRWYISRKPSELGNTWAQMPSGPPELGSHETVDMQPGDLLYLPRGTFHSVDSSAESLHVAIGFTPLTAREAILATLDHLSDLDQTLRTTIGGRLAFQLKGKGFEELRPPVLDGLARLVAAVRTPGFLAAALQRRSARTVATLAALPTPRLSPAIDLDSVLAHTDTAFCHLTFNSEHIDLSYPGGHVYVHRGAMDGVLYIANTPRFTPRDIPGGLADDVRLALVRKLVEVGYLKAVGTLQA
jgi:hypothetical protein